MKIKKKFNSEKFKKDIRSKFKPKNKNVLEKIYEEREKRSSMGGGGKTIFNQDIINELEIKEFKPNTQKEGTYFVEILPCSYDPEDAYFIEVPEHTMVGAFNDKFICMQRFRDKPCYRCKKQKELYGKYKTTTQEIKQLFPNDRAVYLTWDRTNELKNDEDPVYDISVWNAPKKGVHTEIQSKVRNKLKKEILDISDVSEDGDGRTVYFEVEILETVDKDTKQKKRFPSYGSFDLVKRDEPIPDEILQKLDEIISELSKRMTKDMKNPLEVLLHFPKYEEIQEAMADDMYDSEVKEGKKNRLEQMKEKREAKEKEESDDDEIDLEALEEKLDGMNKKEILKWMKKNDMKELMDDDLSKKELIEAILEAIEEAADEKEDLDDIPF